jgi:hypothetical protein
MGIQMRKVLIVVLSACTILSATAQDSLRRVQTGFIQTGIGKAYNLDAIGATGFAKGVTWEPLHIGIGLGKYGGICAAYTYSSYSKQLDEILDWHNSRFPSMHWSIESGRWTTSTFLLGIYGSIPIRKWSVDLEFMLGKGTLSEPATKVIGYTTDKEFGSRMDVAIIRHLTRNQFNAIVPALTARYRINDRWHFFTRFDVQGAVMDWTYYYNPANDPKYDMYFVSSELDDADEIWYPDEVYDGGMIEFRAGFGLNMPVIKMRKWMR